MALSNQAQDTKGSPRWALSASAVIASPIGKLGLVFQQEKLVKVEFLPSNALLKAPKDLLGEKVAAELKFYFENPAHPFNIQFQLEGTVFQKSVWQAMQKIPVGKVMTYGALAAKLKTSPRAIGQACRTNPIPLIIPCHRIVAAEHIGGFSGKREGTSVDIKKWLLAHEQNDC